MSQTVPHCSQPHCYSLCSNYTLYTIYYTLYTIHYISLVTTPITFHSPYCSQPHCGPSNHRLRLHLPVLLPGAAEGGAAMRVGDGPARCDSPPTTTTPLLLEIARHLA